MMTRDWERAKQAFLTLGFYPRGKIPQLKLHHFIGTKQQGLKITEEKGERTFISKHMSDFISSAGTQHSMPSANAGTVHAISKSCLS